MSWAAVAVSALLIPACGSAGPGHDTATQPAPSAQQARSARAAPSGRPAATASGAAARYLAIARPANRRLDRDFDDGLAGDDRGNLAASQADLRAAAATERSFDRQLLALPLAPATEALARVLVAANQSRARLTDEAASATSLARLHGFERRLDAANVPVEHAVRVMRSLLGLPPPESS